MSLCVALQSVLFFVASCAPCHQAKHHRQMKEEAKKHREDKERIRAAYPGAYQQPDPFNTNPYWSEEIMMGPHIQRKKYTGGNKNPSQRNLTSSGKDTTSVGGSTVRVNTSSSDTPPSAAGGAKQNLTSPATDTTPGSGSSIGVSIFNPTAVPSIAEEPKLSMSTTFSDDWNRKRYQREDEELWGDEWSRTGHKLMDAIKHAGASAGRFIEVSLGKETKPITDQDRHNFYFAPKNPPVNDYHPPIVRQRPAHGDAIRWMVQPPPSAKIMEGKIPVSRTASFASHLSRRTTASDGHDLGRAMHEKTIEVKLRSGEFQNEKGPLASTRRPLTGRSRSSTLESADINPDLSSDEVFGRLAPQKRTRPRIKSDLFETPPPSRLSEAADNNADLSSDDAYGPLVYKPRTRQRLRSDSFEPLPPLRLPEAASLRTWAPPRWDMASGPDESEEEKPSLKKSSGPANRKAATAATKPKLNTISSDRMGEATQNDA
ncbi:hypothetical protein GGS20DRAFT_134497 [Poronia punctata]|nr:hypothetical protein GGS20DRAFT_134497 [Poronia punctata]